MWRYGFVLSWNGTFLHEGLATLLALCADVEMR